MRSCASCVTFGFFVAISKYCAKVPSHFRLRSRSRYSSSRFTRSISVPPQGSLAVPGRYVPGGYPAPAIESALAALSLAADLLIRDGAFLPAALHFRTTMGVCRFDRCLSCRRTLSFQASACIAPICTSGSIIGQIQACAEQASAFRRGVSDPLRILLRVTQRTGSLSVRGEPALHHPQKSQAYLCDCKKCTSSSACWMMCAMHADPSIQWVSL